MTWQCKYFLFISEAVRFQRKMQREGYETRKLINAGVAHPCTLVLYKLKIKL